MRRNFETLMMRCQDKHNDASGGVFYLRLFGEVVKGSSIGARSVIFLPAERIGIHKRQHGLLRGRMLFDARFFDIQYSNHTARYL